MVEKNREYFRGSQNEITEFKGGPHEQIQCDFQNAAEAQNSLPKLSAWGPNFLMDMTWERLILLRPSPVEITRLRIVFERLHRHSVSKVEKTVFS